MGTVVPSPSVCRPVVRAVMYQAPALSVNVSQLHCQRVRVSGGGYLVT